MRRSGGTNEHKCQYCGAGYTSSFACCQHEATCPNRPQNNNDDNKDGNQLSPNPNPGGGGGSNGNNTGNSNSYSKPKTAYKDFNSNLSIVDIVGKASYYKMCSYVYPSRLIQQIDIHNCVPSSLAMLELMLNPDMTKEQYFANIYDSWDNYCKMGYTEYDFYTKGLSESLMPKYMYKCGLKQIEKSEVYNTLDLGEPMIGVINDFKYNNDFLNLVQAQDLHAVTIIGEGTTSVSYINDDGTVSVNDSTPVYFCMDPWTAQYTPIPQSYFSNIFKKK